MAGRVAEVTAVSALALVLTLAIAAPVLRAPSERIFGMETVGRHYDPFIAMQQFGRPLGDIARGHHAEVDGGIHEANYGEADRLQPDGASVPSGSHSVQ